MITKIKSNGDFLHIPKTGGSWVYKVLEVNDLIVKLPQFKHYNYDLNLFEPLLYPRGNQRREQLRFIKKCAGQFIFPEKSRGNYRRFRFCFVRNPLTWYESWWNYMEGLDWPNYGEENSAYDWHPNSVLNGLGSNDFNEFIWNVIQKRPGYVSELYHSYTKSGINFIGRQEHLQDDLLDLLTLLKLDFKYDSIFDMTKVNVSKKGSNRIDWDPKLKAIIMKLELPALTHYGYLTRQEQISLGIERYIPPNKALNKGKI